jgi:hypothetical protein
LAWFAAILAEVVGPKELCVIDIFVRHHDAEVEGKEAYDTHDLRHDFVPNPEASLAAALQRSLAVMTDSKKARNADQEH